MGVVLLMKKYFVLISILSYFLVCGLLIVLFYFEDYDYAFVLMGLPIVILMPYAIYSIDKVDCKWLQSHKSFKFFVITIPTFLVGIVASMFVAVRQGIDKEWLIKVGVGEISQWSLCIVFSLIKCKRQDVLKALGTNSDKAENK